MTIFSKGEFMKASAVLYRYKRGNHFSYKVIVKARKWKIVSYFYLGEDEAKKDVLRLAKNLGLEIIWCKPDIEDRAKKGCYCSGWERHDIGNYVPVRGIKCNC